MNFNNLLFTVLEEVGISTTSSTSTQLSRLHTVRGTLVNSIHKDDDDDVFYRVADVTLQRIRNEDVLVAHKIEHPTAKRPKTGVH